ncbi:transporter substrate-binding domain-containing protein [Desulfamplus magnetovallimortis]|nr:transporter substrate-binding domain-containing protein [Desulfamplus magnetovallimortis]
MSSFFSLYKNGIAGFFVRLCFVFFICCSGDLIFCSGDLLYGYNSNTVRLNLTEAEEQFLREHPVIRVSNEMDWPPFDFAISGQPFGFSIDLLNILGERLGIEWEYVNGYQWLELMELFKKGEIDVLQSVYKDEEREELGLFTRPYFRDKTVFIISRYSKPVSSIDQLKGKIIVAPKGWAYESFLRKYYPDIDLLSVRNMEEAFHAIVQGKADAAIELSGVAQFMFEKHYFDSLKVSGWFEEYDRGLKKALHIMVRNDWPILHEMLEKGLESLTPGELIELEKKWLGYRNIYPSQKITLTPDEKLFLEKNSVIRVANEMDWPPFDYMENGKPAGFVMDYIALIGEMIGIELELINGYTWPELLNMGQQKEIDIFPGIWKTAEREKFLTFTPPYMKLTKVLVSKDNNLKNYPSLSHMKGKKIALPEGYGTTELVVNEYPGPEYIIVKNNEEGMNLLEMDTVDGFVGTLGVVNYILKKHFMTDIKVIMEIELSHDLPLQIAVRDDWPVMATILNKAIENVTSEQYDALVSKWIGTIDGLEKITTLSIEEKRYLEQKKQLCIGVIDPLNMPYEYISEENTYEGIVADYYKLVCSKTGLFLKWKVMDSVEAANKELQKGNCDIISVVNTSDSELVGINITTPYVEYPLVIATDNMAVFISALENLSKKKIGIVQNSPFYYTMVKKYPAIEFVAVNSVPDGLFMVQEKKIFGLISTAPEIAHYIQLNQMVDLKISGEVPYRVEFRTGVSKDNKMLLDIMEKASNSMTQEQKNHLFHNWIRVTYQKGLDHAVLWQFGTAFLLIIAFFIYRHVSITRYNRKLTAINKEFVQANRKLEAISYIDGLTQIPNRRRFDAVLETEWQRCERNQHYLTLIMMDIDYFKLYNDRYGHLSGDECLKKVAEVLHRVPGRSSDFVARYGGEEFGVILPDTDEVGAKAVAKRILDDVQALKLIHEDSSVSDYVSVSLGVASVVPSRLLFPRQLVDFADQLLYQAKKGGRNRYEFLILE